MTIHNLTIEKLRLTFGPQLQTIRFGNAIRQIAGQALREDSVVYRIRPDAFYINETTGRLEIICIEVEDQGLQFICA